MDEKTAGQLISNPEIRKEMRKTLLGFALLYLPHYFTLPPAKFHPELFALLEDFKNQFLEITGFRSSAKSTIAGLILILWAALEETSHFIIPVNDTDDVGKLTIANIRRELEENELLKADYGDMTEGGKKLKFWTQNNLLLANGVRIMSRSRGQKIRGLRHLQYRPDLVVIDDPEELEKVQKKEYRDKTERWLRGDIIPAIEELNARMIVIGNMLHNDSLLARLKNDPIFLHREYPLIDENGNVSWPDKYPTKEALARQEQKVGRTAWLREYCLKVVPPEGQEVKEEWIKRYDKLPGQTAGKSGVGVDLAISKSQYADFTAMVSGILSIEEGMPKIYILPNPVNDRLSFHETQQQLKSIHLGLRIYAHPTFYIEDVAYQKAAIQEAQRLMLSVRAIKPGADKRARLRTVATFIQNGTVLFPKQGSEDIIDQLINFGVTDHDDLCDAFVYLVLGLSQEGIEMPEVILLG
jgi:predicted phage terminase large subunit-like protein